MKDHDAYGKLRDFQFAVSVGYPALQGIEVFRLLHTCLHSNDQASWSEFVRRTQPVIAGVIVKAMRRWRSPSPATVDDLVQETYLKLCANDFKALREFDCEHDNALYGFLKVVASHVVHDYFRSSYSQKRGSGKEAEELEPASTSRADGSASMRNMEREILFQEISECLEVRAAGPNFARDYAIFWLYYVQGFTARAIARLPRIGLTVKGVESTLLRLTRLVREGLTGKSSTDDD
ncbi:MAG: sigma-70 family RNA polymerase sigma factor [Acidobacteriia bacterium]|nr:sigma-70 family RNA polymerase sigma factor [Terriglobia bacterium]